MRFRVLFAVVATVAMLQPGWSHAISCDVLQAEVEAKIRSAGVQDFAVSIVRADADMPGKVVGTCDQGAGKLLYTRGGSPSDAVAIPNQAAVPSEPILTECRDGTVSMGGVCQR